MKRAIILMGALAMIAGAAHACDQSDTGSTPAGNHAAAAAREPAPESCPRTCANLRVSTRCECSLRKVLPATAGV